jgi:hypothetical protein
MQLTASAVNRTLVISLRGEDAFGRKEASQFVVLQRTKYLKVIVLQKEPRPKRFCCRLWTTSWLISFDRDRWVFLAVGLREN